jgi:hypothetical protein
MDESRPNTTEGGLDRPPSVGDQLPCYLVEVFLPRSRGREARASARRARHAAVDLSSEGVPIRYVRTIFLPDDETCFHFFEADSTASVDQVSRRASLGHVRVVSVREAPGRSRREPR